VVLADGNNGRSPVNLTFQLSGFTQATLGPAQIATVNSNGSERWYVDFRYSVGRFAPLSFAPTNSGTFTNGVWSGPVTVQSAGTNVTLRARDSAQHGGISGVFNVFSSTDSDLSLRITAPSLPARFISNLVYSVQISNAGPASASGIQVTSAIPAELEFVSASGGPGPCIQSNGVVTCPVPDLSPSTTATLLFTVRPLGGGNVTNSLAVTTSGFDPIPDNDLDTSLVFICRDCDGDGISAAFERLGSDHDPRRVALGHAGMICTRLSPRSSAWRVRSRTPRLVRR